MFNKIQYPDEFTNRLHALWGDGFLSPGGVEEVNEIVTDLDLSDKVVLDIGFGTGGPAISLLKNHRVAKLVGIDVEHHLLEKAMANAEKAGVGDKIEFKIVDPGALQFKNESFDVVFSKDSLVHVQKKAELLNEIFRVLKKGGVFAASDWLRGGDSESKPAMDKFMALAHLEFTMATAQQMEDILKRSGFKHVSTRDRNSWFAKLAREELHQIEGPLYQQLVDTSGEQAISYWLDVKRAQAHAAQSGGLRPTHLRGFKPD